MILYKDMNDSAQCQRALNNWHHTPLQWRRINKTGIIHHCCGEELTVNDPSDDPENWTIVTCQVSTIYHTRQQQKLLPLLHTAKMMQTSESTRNKVIFPICNLLRSL